VNYDPLLVKNEFVAILRQQGLVDAGFWLKERI
jgi:hypothetical protein